MKKLSLAVKVVFVLLVSAVIACSCNPFGLLGNAPEGVTVPSNATEARKLYTQVVQAEIGDTAYNKRYTSAYSQGFQKIVEQNTVAKSCTKDLDKLVSDAMAGRFSNVDPTTNRPEPTVNQGIAIKAYAPTEGYPAGIDCSGLYDKLFKEVGLWRSNNADMSGVLFDRIAARHKLYRSDIVTTIQLDLVTVVAGEAAAKGYPYAKKFIFPTYNLEVDSHSKPLCEYYTKLANDPATKDDGYIVPGPWNPVTETCILRGLAADEHMSTVIVVDEVAKTFDTKKDSSPLGPTK